MRKIYLAVISFVTLCALLFVATFMYLDKTKRKTYHYVVKLQGRDIGTVRVDRFITEDKIIYKSACDMPFDPLYTEYRSRLALDREYSLESYTKEYSAGRATELVYVENFKNLISFVSRHQADFACVDNIPIEEGTFVFEEDFPVTYLPIIESYNFSRGRSQGFKGLICPAQPGLPPMKRFVTLTSIRDEYLKIDSRKIKTENLILKIKNYPQGSVWVAKSDRSIVRIEIPEKALVITRTFHPKVTKPVAREIKSDGYVSKVVVFKDLAGTLTVPDKEGKFPAVLLAWGPGPQDRDYQGFFVSLADYLSKNGFCVLRFDKRGTGSSKGDAASYADSDEVADLKVALEYLTAHKSVDPGKIAVIGHSKGAYNAMKLSYEGTGSVKALVLMAPSVVLGGDDNARAEALKAMALKFKWGDDYKNLVMRTVRETESKAKESKGSWLSILGKKCFLDNVREELAGDPLDVVKSVKVPVLILQGGKDDEIMVECAPRINKALGEAGNTNATLTYYGYLGHFLGERINDGVHRIYYDIDKEVLGNIKNWLDKSLVETPALPKEEPTALQAVEGKS